MGKYSWSDKQNERRESRRPEPKKRLSFPGIRKASKKLSRARVKYNQLSKKYLEDHPICEICGLKRATEIHHKKGRGIYLLLVKFFLGVCNECHVWITDHSKEAIEMGYSVKRND